MQGLRQTSHKKICTSRLIDLEVNISFLVKDDDVFDILYLTLTFSTSDCVMTSMVVYSKTLTISSSSKQQLIDITLETMRFVEDSNITNGILVVSVPHATAAIVANENERGLLNDILNRIREVFPQSADYAHNRIDDNANAHIAATFLGHSRTFPVENHQIVRGTWQNIFVLELDGPRTRREIHLNLIS